MHLLFSLIIFKKFKQVNQRIRKIQSPTTNIYDDDNDNDEEDNNARFQKPPPKNKNNPNIERRVVYEFQEKVIECVNLECQ